MTMGLAPAVDGLNRTSQTRRHRLAFDDSLTAPRAAPVMRESQQVEGFRLAASISQTCPGTAAVAESRRAAFSPDESSGRTSSNVCPIQPARDERPIPPRRSSPRHPHNEPIRLGRACTAERRCGTTRPGHSAGRRSPIRAKSLHPAGCHGPGNSRCPIP